MKFALFALLALALVLSTEAGKLRRQDNQDNGNKDKNWNYNNNAYDLVLDSHFNVQYSGKFTIGGQSFPVIYDTGSFEVLVLSTLCTQCLKTLAMYDSSKSQTFTDGKLVADHDFVSGKVTTREGFETLTLGLEDSPVHADKMTFWMIQKHELQFWKTGNAIFSGIVGLSHVKHIPSGFGGDPFQDKSMAEEMHLNDFAICLERSDTGEAPGHLKFGPAVDELWKDKNLFSTVDVSGDSHWSTKLSSFQVQGEDTSNLCKPSCGALIDSGTSLLTFPRSAQHIADSLKAKVKPDIIYPSWAQPGSDREIRL